MDNFKPFPPETRINPPEKTPAQELLATPVPFLNRVEFISDYDKSFPETHTAAEIGEILTLSEPILDSMLEEVDASIVDISSDGQPIYEQFTLEVVREELKWLELYKQVDDYIVVKKMAHYLDKRVIWVENRLNELGVTAPERRMPSGHMGRGYPKITLQRLRHIKLHAPPANNTHAMNELESLLGVHRDWIKPRLEKLGATILQRTSMLSGEAAPHITEEAYEALREMKQNLAPPAGDWLTVGTMARELGGKDRKWVLARIKGFKDVKEMRRDDFNRELVHYPPYVLEYLRTLL